MREMPRAGPGVTFRRVLVGGLLSASLYAAPVAAIDLLRSYELALINDGQLKVARAQADAGREALPQATAQLWPNVSLAYATGRTERTRTLGSLSEPTQYFRTQSATLSLRQPIYRHYLFYQVDQAKAKMAGVEAQLDTDYQGLGVRVAKAYFEALFARDSLAFIGAQKITYEAQLRAAKLALKAGSGTRTDIDEIQARHDVLLADEIKAEQAVEAFTEQLQIFVGEPITSLATLDPARFHAEAHDPISLQEWVHRALEYNPELRMLGARRDAALAGIEMARAGHYPTLDLVLQQGQSVGDSTNTNPRIETQTGYVGLQLNIPILAGGYVDSSIREAVASAEQARLAFEQAREDLRLKVKREFDALKAGVARTRALQVALTAADQVVLSNQKGVQAGTRTTLDVLTVEQQRFNTRVDLAQARYQLLVSWASLHGYVGDLNTERMGTISSVLREPR